MDIFPKRWHVLHAKNIRKRENTRPERLRKRKLEKNRPQKSIQAPTVMHFFKNYHETVEFIDKIRKYVFQDKVNVFLDFSECQEISAETCVVLAAEIDRCRKKIPNSVWGSYPKNDYVYFLLNELGFFKMLRIRSRDHVCDSSPEIDIVKIHSGSGKAAPKNLIKGIGELFSPEDGKKPKKPNEAKMYPALSEAMYNAVEHAYPKDFTKKNGSTCVPNWWRAGFRINEDNTVVIVLYDQGAGIPNTLHIRWKELLEKQVSKFGRLLSDDEKIALAMGKGRSRTGVEGRGHGSYDMQSIIKESLGGFLSIFSYNGKYVYFSNDKHEQEKLSRCLYGTLVVWQISLDRTKVK